MSGAVQLRCWLIMQPSLAFLESDSPCAPTPILQIKVRFYGIFLHMKQVEYKVLWIQRKQD